MSIMPFPDVAGGLAISPGCFGPPDPYTTPMPSLGAPNSSCGANQFPSNSASDCQGTGASGSSGDTVNPASVLPMSLTSQYAAGCPPPDTGASGANPVPPVPGIAPPAVPGSGSAYSMEALPVTSNIPLGGVPIYCEETGVTLVSGVCAEPVGATFYFATTGTYHFIAYAGSYEDCSTLLWSNYPQGTGSGTLPGQSGPVVIPM